MTGMKPAPVATWRRRGGEGDGRIRREEQRGNGERKVRREGDEREREERWRGGKEEKGSS